MSDRVLAHLIGDRAGYLERHTELVACPSVSADATFAEGIAAARDWLMRRLTALGFDKVRLLAADGQPCAR